MPNNNGTNGDMTNNANEGNGDMPNKQNSGKKSYKRWVMVYRVLGYILIALLVIWILITLMEMYEKSKS